MLEPAARRRLREAREEAAAERLAAEATDCTTACVMGHTNEPGCLYGTTVRTAGPVPTGAAEREPMSSERLARLRANNEPRGDHASSLTADDVGELLDEVDRARAEVVVAWEFCDATQAAFNAEYVTNRQLRARLAALGEPGWRYRAFGPNNEIAFDPDGNDRWTMAQLGGWRVERRPVYSGAWEPAPGPTEGGTDG